MKASTTVLSSEEAPKSTTQDIRIWTPHDNQKKLSLSKKRFKVIRCGRRFGKTTYVLADMVKRALLTKNYRGFYVGPTYKQAKMIAWDLLLRILRGDSSAGFGGLPKALVRKINESELYVVLGNGSRIDIKGSDNPDSLRGVGLNDVRLDEFAYHSDPQNLWEKVLKPALLDKGGSADIISTPNGFDNFYDMEMEALKDPDNWDTFHFSTYDNPMIPADEIDKLKKTTPEDEFAQEYMAEYRKKVGLVYPEFRREAHITLDTPNTVVEKISAVDFGYTNPAAILSILKDADSHYWIVDEWYETEKTTKDIIEQIRSFSPNVTYPDPAEPDRIKEMKDAGIYVADVSKDVVAGIDRVRRLFLANRIHIHPRCSKLILELETYSYPDKKMGMYNRNEPEKPKKENDHACFVAGTQILTTRGNVPIEKVSLGDSVITPFGPSKVVAAQITGLYPVVDYGAFTATPNHPILTSYGSSPVDALCYADSICQPTQKQFSFTEYLIAGILTQRKEVKDFIFDALLTRSLEAQRGIYTEMFGNQSMEKSPRDMLYIIKMGTTTTQLRLLNLLLKKNTQHDMLGESMKDLPNILNELDLLLNCGTVLNKDESGMQTTQKEHGLEKCPLLQSVLNAVESTLLTSLVEAGSVIRTVRPELSDKGTQALVYNLSTEVGMYFANGVLVSNCDALRYALFMNSDIMVAGKETEFSLYSHTYD